MRTSTLLDFASIPPGYSNRYLNAGSAHSATFTIRRSRNSTTNCGSKTTRNFPIGSRNRMRHSARGTKHFRSINSQRRGWRKSLVLFVAMVVPGSGLRCHNGAKVKDRPRLKQEIAPKRPPDFRVFYLAHGCAGMAGGKIVLWIGTKRENYGVLKWVPYCEYKEPRQISITHEADSKWFVGFSFESGKFHRSTRFRRPKRKCLASIGESLIRQQIAPDDSTILRQPRRSNSRGARKTYAIANPAGPPEEGSKRRAKTKQAIAATHAKDKRLRLNAAHRIAHHLVNQALETGYKAIGFENLQLSNMTRRANAKQDIDGQYLPNGQAAKSGLNKSMLGRGLGQLKTLVHYRCRRSGLMFVEVDPAYTSTECTECHHKDKRNRQSQSDFECVRCGHKEHADVIGGTNVRDKAFKKITEISPGTSLKNARLSKARKGQPLEFV